jgi:Mg-chelatase subunit ChlD
MFGKFFGVSSFEPRTEAIAARSERDIALVLDVSGSMADFGRFPALKNALDVFLNELASSPQEEFVSLSVYSTDARKKVNLTSDLEAIRIAFASEFPDGFTAIGRGLELGMNSLLNDRNSRNFALKTVVIMTDGNHNRGIEPALVAADCARNRIQVHTVTFSQDADVNRMRDVARIAGGIHFHANTNQELIDQFRIIARQLKVVLIK